MIHDIGGNEFVSFLSLILFIEKYKKKLNWLQCDFCEVLYQTKIYSLAFRIGFVGQDVQYLIQNGVTPILPLENITFDLDIALVHIGISIQLWLIVQPLYCTKPVDKNALNNGRHTLWKCDQ